MTRDILLLLSVLLFSTAVSGCAPTKLDKPSSASLLEVARSDRQWTGIAVARDGRIFVNYPRWSDNVPFAGHGCGQTAQFHEYMQTASLSTLQGSTSTTRPSPAAPSIASKPAGCAMLV